MSVIVETTYPVLGLPLLPLPLLSNRLIIRRYSEADLEPFHTFATQPEAMGGNPVSPDLHNTKLMLDKYQQPLDYAIWLAIFLKKSVGSEG